MSENAPAERRGADITPFSKVFMSLSSQTSRASPTWRVELQPERGGAAFFNAQRFLQHRQAMRAVDADIEPLLPHRWPPCRTSMPLLDADGIYSAR